MTNTKYVVFKAEDFDALHAILRHRLDDAGVAALDGLTEKVLDDAEVIRKQDILAGPVLHAYAGTADTYISALKLDKDMAETRHVETIKTLEGIRDHFHEAAVEADEWPTKKVPD